MSVFEGFSGSAVVILSGELKESRNMSSQRAWLTAVAFLTSSSPNTTAGLDACIASCRKTVWADHLGCEYGSGAALQG